MIRAARDRSLFTLSFLLQPNPTCMSSDCGRESEYPERTRELYKERPLLVCGATVLNTAPPSRHSYYMLPFRVIQGNLETKNEQAWSFGLVNFHICQAIINAERFIQVMFFSNIVQYRRHSAHAATASQWKNPAAKLVCLQSKHATLRTIFSVFLGHLTVAQVKSSIKLSKVISWSPQLPNPYTVLLKEEMRQHGGNHTPIPPLLKHLVRIKLIDLYCKFYLYFTQCRIFSGNRLYKIND